MCCDIEFYVSQSISPWFDTDWSSMVILARNNFDDGGDGDDERESIFKIEYPSITHYITNNFTSRSLFQFAAVYRADVSVWAAHLWKH
jgi:hypothetical protein